MLAPAAPNRNLVLAAMIFAVAMTFIDQTIVSIAVPHYFSLDFAYATQTVLYVMCGIMGFAGLVAFVALRRGLQEASPEEASAISG